MNTNDPKEELEKLRKFVDDRIKKVVPNYLQQSAFADRKLSDTPTDDLQVTPRKYVNMNGVVANRPKSSIASVGMSFYATDTGIPMTYSIQGWRNGVSSIVALNN